MTHQIIEKIEQKMRAHLNVEQQNILHNALLQCLSEEIVQSGESGTENFVKIFLAAKRVEGCSEKTVRYYDSTIRNVLSAIGKDINQVTTDD